MSLGKVTFNTHEINVRLIFPQLPPKARCKVSATPLNVSF